MQPAYVPQRLGSHSEAFSKLSLAASSTAVVRRVSPQKSVARGCFAVPTKVLTEPARFVSAVPAPLNDASLKNLESRFERLEFCEVTQKEAGHNCAAPRQEGGAAIMERCTPSFVALDT
jgi:hypothetical protein